MRHRAKAAQPTEPPTDFPSEPPTEGLLEPPAEPRLATEPATEKPQTMVTTDPVIKPQEPTEQPLIFTDPATKSYEAIEQPTVVIRTDPVSEPEEITEKPMVLIHSDTVIKPADDIEKPMEQVHTDPVVQPQDHVEKPMLYIDPVVKSPEQLLTDPPADAAPVPTPSKALITKPTARAEVIYTLPEGTDCSAVDTAGFSTALTKLVSSSIKDVNIGALARCQDSIADPSNRNLLMMHFAAQLDAAVLFTKPDGAVSADFTTLEATVLGKLLDQILAASGATQQLLSGNVKTADPEILAARTAVKVTTVEVLQPQGGGGTVQVVITPKAMEGHNMPGPSPTTVTTTTLRSNVLNDNQMVYITSTGGDNTNMAATAAAEADSASASCGCIKAPAETSSRWRLEFVDVGYLPGSSSVMYRMSVATVMPHLCTEPTHKPGHCCNQTVDSITMSVQRHIVE